MVVDVDPGTSEKGLRQFADAFQRRAVHSDADIRQRRCIVADGDLVIMRHEAEFFRECVLIIEGNRKPCRG